MPDKIVLGFFANEEALLEATRRARAQDLAIHDTYAPYAIHGLDDAMGLPRSPLAKVCFAAGVTGTVSAFAMQLWISAVDWPINIGGKSFTALPALVPVAFELTILFAALGTIAALVLICGLWPGKEANPGLEAANDDRFVLALSVDGEKISIAKKLLSGEGAEEVREV